MKCEKCEFEIKQSNIEIRKHFTNSGKLRVEVVHSCGYFLGYGDIDIRS